ALGVRHRRLTPRRAGAALPRRRAHQLRTDRSVEGALLLPGGRLRSLGVLLGLAALDDLDDGRGLLEAIRDVVLVHRVLGGEREAVLVEQLRELRDVEVERDLLAL